MGASGPDDEVREISNRYGRLYTILLDAIPSSVLLIDQALRIVSANRNFLEKSHRTLLNTIGERLEGVLPDVILDQLDICKRIRQVIAKNRAVRGERMTYRAPGIPIRTYYFSILPFMSQGKVEGVILLMDDVTEQIRLSEDVRRMERHLASIVESASDLFISTDRKGMILTWNRSAELLSGYLEAEMRERCFFEIFTDEDQAAIRGIFTLVYEEKFAEVKEYSFRSKQTRLIPVSWAFSPLKDSHNKTVGVVVVGRDLTERKKFEAELLQSEKLAALGVMAGGIAHEIRNPLAICSSSAQFLLNDDLSPELRRDYVERILRGIRRTAVIIENLLKYAHSPATPIEKTPVDLVPLIRETVILATYHAKVVNVGIETSFSRESITVEGVAALLEQAFMNLFLNAINAMPGGGLLKIKVGVEEATVYAQVSDTGCGISRDGLEKLFDPFYTTSTVGKGTGLGLSICYSAIKHHGGTIEVESAEGKGSNFTVKLPLARRR